MEALEYGLEALVRYEKAARSYDVLARRYHSAIGAERQRIDGERQFFRTELARLVRRYAARMRENGVSVDEMIATVTAIVGRAVVRVGWRHGGALVLEILDWGLDGYYGGVDGYSRGVSTQLAQAAATGGVRGA